MPSASFISMQREKKRVPFLRFRLLLEPQGWPFSPKAPECGRTWGWIRCTNNTKVFFPHICMSVICWSARISWDTQIIPSSLNPFSSSDLTTVILRLLFHVCVGGIARQNIRVLFGEERNDRPVDVLIVGCSCYFHQSGLQTAQPHGYPGEERISSWNRLAPIASVQYAVMALSWNAKAAAFFFLIRTK